jgi:hypothetical protein
VLHSILVELSYCSVVLDLTESSVEVVVLDVPVFDHARFINTCKIGIRFDFFLLGGPGHRFKKQRGRVFFLLLFSVFLWGAAPASCSRIFKS